MPEPEPADAAAAMLARIGSVMLMVMSRYCVATETTASPYRLYRTKRRPNNQPAMKIGMLGSTFHTAELQGFRHVIDQKRRPNTPPEMSMGNGDGFHAVRTGHPVSKEFQECPSQGTNGS